MNDLVVKIDIALEVPIWQNANIKLKKSLIGGISSGDADEPQKSTVAEDIELQLLAAPTS